MSDETGRVINQGELERSRNRAIWTVRLVTLAGVGGAVGITWGFAGMAEAYFSGKPPAPPAPPEVPQAATPVQQAPPVVISVVHHPGQPPASSGAAPRPPAAAPAAAGPAPAAPKPPAPAGLPLNAVQAMLSCRFEAMGVVNTVVVDDPAALPEALAIAKAQVMEIDQVCSRFKPESELSRLNQAAGREVKLSSLLEEALAAALQAAAMTGGLVDPTVGANVREAGYTVTYSAMELDGQALELRVSEVVGWRAIELDQAAHTVSFPEGVSLDLGASGKAWAADRAAEAVARSLGGGVLVECGGDVAARGRVPDGGWPVRVATDVDAPDGQDVRIGAGGLATSGTPSRPWRRGREDLHDIIDPTTGRPAKTPWAMAAVAAATCLEANAAATAALILGDRAPEWLDGLRLPARLVRNDGSVRYTGGWVG